MFLIMYIFTLAILCIFDQAAGLAMLPKVEENDIAKTETVIRKTINALFYSLTLRNNNQSKTRIKQYSLIHNYLVSLTLKDYNSLKEIAKLTRVDKGDMENLTTDFISLINTVLDEESDMKLKPILGDTEIESGYSIENEIEKLKYLKEKHAQNKNKILVINEEVLKILHQPESLDLNVPTTTKSTVDYSDENILDENTFWHEIDESFNGRRIYNGKRTKIKRYGFMASIEIFNTFQCTGSIISTDLIITAASCLQLAWNNRFFRENPPFLSVRVGSSFYEIGGEKVGVQEIYFHPGYNPRNLQNNLAILRLERRLNFKKKKVKKIRIDKREGKLSNSAGKIQILGWGASTRSNKLQGPWSDKLREAFLHIYPHGECRDLYSEEYVTETNFCGGSIASGTGACNHDIGGPGIISEILIGVISFGAPTCGTPDAPTVFTKLGFYYDWVEEIMEQEVPHYKKKTTLLQEVMYPNTYYTESPQLSAITPINKFMRSENDSIYNSNAQSIDYNLFNDYLGTMFTKDYKIQRKGAAEYINPMQQATPTETIKGAYLPMEYNGTQDAIIPVVKRNYSKTYTNKKNCLYEITTQNMIPVEKLQNQIQQLVQATKDEKENREKELKILMSEIKANNQIQNNTQIINQDSPYQLMYIPAEETILQNNYNNTETSAASKTSTYAYNYNDNEALSSNFVEVLVNNGSKFYKNHDIQSSAKNITPIIENKLHYNSQINNTFTGSTKSQSITSDKSFRKIDNFISNDTYGLAKNEREFYENVMTNLENRHLNYSEKHNTLLQLIDFLENPKKSQNRKITMNIQTKDDILHMFRDIDIQGEDKDRILQLLDDTLLPQNLLNEYSSNPMKKVSDDTYSVSFKNAPLSNTVEKPSKKIDRKIFTIENERFSQQLRSNYKDNQWNDYEELTIKKLVPVEQLKNQVQQNYFAVDNMLKVDEESKADSKTYTDVYSYNYNEVFSPNLINNDINDQLITFEVPAQKEIPAEQLQNQVEQLVEETKQETENQVNEIQFLMSKINAISEIHENESMQMGNKSTTLNIGMQQFQDSESQIQNRMVQKVSKVNEDSRGDSKTYTDVYNYNVNDVLSPSFWQPFKYNTLRTAEDYIKNNNNELVKEGREIYNIFRNQDLNDSQTLYRILQNIPKKLELDHILNKNQIEELEDSIEQMIMNPALQDKQKYNYNIIELDDTRPQKLTDGIYKTQNIFDKRQTEEAEMDVPMKNSLKILRNRHIPEKEDTIASLDKIELPKNNFIEQQNGELTKELIKKYVLQVLDNTNIQGKENEDLILSLLDIVKPPKPNFIDKVLLDKEEIQNHVKPEREINVDKIIPSLSELSNRLEYSDNSYFTATEPPHLVNPTEHQKVAIFDDISQSLAGLSKYSPEKNSPIDYKQAVNELLSSESNSLGIANNFKSIHNNLQSVIEDFQQVPETTLRKGVHGDSYNKLLEKFDDVREDFAQNKTLLLSNEKREHDISEQYAKNKDDFNNSIIKILSATFRNGNKINSPENHIISMYSKLLRNDTVSKNKIAKILVSLMQNNSKEESKKGPSISKAYSDLINNEQLVKKRILEILPLLSTDDKTKSKDLFDAKNSNDVDDFGEDYSTEQIKNKLAKEKDNMNFLLYTHKILRTKELMNMKKEKYGLNENKKIKTDNVPYTTQNILYSTHSINLSPFNHGNLDDSIIKALDDTENIDENRNIFMWAPNKVQDSTTHQKKSILINKPIKTKIDLNLQPGRVKSTTLSNINTVIKEENELFNYNNKQNIVEFSLNLNRSYLSNALSSVELENKIKTIGELENAVEKSNDSELIIQQDISKKKAIDSLHEQIMKALNWSSGEVEDNRTLIEENAYDRESFNSTIFYNKSSSITPKTTSRIFTNHIRPSTINWNKNNFIKGNNEQFNKKGKEKKMNESSSYDILPLLHSQINFIESSVNHVLQELNDSKRTQPEMLKNIIGGTTTFSEKKRFDIISSPYASKKSQGSFNYVAGQYPGFVRSDIKQLTSR